VGPWCAGWRGVGLAREPGCEGVLSGQVRRWAKVIWRCGELSPPKALAEVGVWDRVGNAIAPDGGALIRAVYGLKPMQPGLVVIWVP